MKRSLRKKIQIDEEEEEKKEPQAEKKQTKLVKRTIFF